MDTKYEVPIIPHNLRSEETVVQIAEALNYLADVSTDIFKRINTRIAQNKSRVDAISARISKASSKLDKLAGAKKATLVFSSSKYPAEHVNESYKSIFHECNEVLPITKYKHAYKSSQIGDEQAEALQFYYVNLKNAPKKTDLSGIGSTPNDIEAINDLIMFNSGKNPYISDSSHDRSNTSLSSASRKLDKSPSDDVDIGAAPYSLSQGINMRQNLGENYFYAPNLGSVPTIDVPLDLPDLQGIADDLRYHTEKEQTIAPSISLSLASGIPDLPAVDDSPSEKGTENISAHTDEAPTMPDQPVIKPTEKKPEIQAPVVASPPVQIKTEETVDSQIQKPVKITEPKANNQSQQKQPVSKAPSVPVPDNSRANLMEAIRKAGGSKGLKSKEMQTSTPNKAPPPTGDLMADLHSKLSMRRKGISGNKVEEPTVMEKISAMIPPPPDQINSQSDVSDTTEDEWDE